MNKKIIVIIVIIVIVLGGWWFFWKDSAPLKDTNNSVTDFVGEEVMPIPRNLPCSPTGVA